VNQHVQKQLTGVVGAREVAEREGTHRLHRAGPFDNTPWRRLQTPVGGGWMLTGEVAVEPTPNVRDRFPWKSSACRGSLQQCD
jgi:hypothetical protein